MLMFLTQAREASAYAHGEADVLKAVEPTAEKNTESVPYMALYQYADSWDIVLMSIGTLGAAFMGGKVPATLVQPLGSYRTLADANLSHGGRMPP